MKKVTLLKLYKDAEGLLKKHGIEITAESELRLACDITKEHDESESKLHYTLRFSKNHEDMESLFGYGDTAVEVFNCFALSVTRSLGIKRVLETVITE